MNQEVKILGECVIEIFYDNICFYILWFNLFIKIILKLGKIVRGEIGKK